MRRLTLLLLCLLAPTFADPWGKDSEMTAATPIHTEECPCAPGQWLGEKLVIFYQNHISAVGGTLCHFRPSCSEYTKQAIQKQGFVKGVLAGFDRLMRDNKEGWIYDTVEECNRTYKKDELKN